MTLRAEMDYEVLHGPDVEFKPYSHAEEGRDYDLAAESPAITG